MGHVTRSSRKSSRHPWTRAKLERNLPGKPAVRAHRYATNSTVNRMTESVSVAYHLTLLILAALLATAFYEFAMAGSAEASSKLT